MRASRGVARRTKAGGTRQAAHSTPPAKISATRPYRCTSTAEVISGDRGRPRPNAATTNATTATTSPPSRNRLRTPRSLIALSTKASASPRPTKVEVIWQPAQRAEQTRAIGGCADRSIEQRGNGQANGDQPQPSTGARCRDSTRRAAASRRLSTTGSATAVRHRDLAGECRPFGRTSASPGIDPASPARATRPWRTRLSAPMRCTSRAAMRSRT